MLRLVPVESGWMECNTDIMCAGGCEGEGERIRFPVTCWLIEHPQGNVLFDTGLHAELINSSERIGFAATLFDVELELTLTEQLSRQGFAATDIDIVVFSHLHFDHSGATAELPNARIIVQASEWQAGHETLNVERGVYNPADFDIGHEVQQISGEYDIFGDGAVVCVPTPGHTAGHQCVRVELGSGPHLLVGDCCYFGSMLDGLRLPKMSLDAELQVASMKKLISMRDAGVKLLFGHDREQWLGINYQPLV